MRTNLGSLLLQAFTLMFAGQLGWAAGVGQASGQVENAPLDLPQRFGTVALAVAERTAEVKKAEAEVKTAQAEVKAIQARIAELSPQKNVPQPGQLRVDRSQEVARQQQLLISAQQALSNKTLALRQANERLTSAVTEFEAFRRENPTVTNLPTQGKLANRLKSHNILQNFNAKKLLDVANETRLNGERFHSAAVGAGQTGTPRPNNPYDPFPKTGTSGAQGPRRSPSTSNDGSGSRDYSVDSSIAVQTAKKALDGESNAILAEASRLAGWRQDLERRFRDLDGRIKTHDRNKPDSFNESAVRIYNSEADRLNREAADWKSEASQFDSAVTALRQRGRDFEQRVQKIQKK